MYKWNNTEIPILQLGSDFYDAVEPAYFPEHIERYINTSLNLQIDPKHFYDFKPLKDNLQRPLALRYHGHQFQHYNPDLGDGRGFLFAQLKVGDTWFDLGTKGSGQTPYSRNGDGRLTLKGAFRESLATELLESLGVNTSKTLSFFETGENLTRNDEPSPARSAVLTRYCKGHIRIGTFQRLAYLQQIENIKKLTSYCLFFYYPELYHELDPEDELLIATSFYLNVIKKSALLVAQVMMGGFVHGVLNTDNINISGELFDFGPYRFLPTYDPSFTAAYFDHQGLYCFGRQPASFLWALAQLGECLKTAYPQLAADELLQQFSGFFQQATQTQFLKRLNLKAKSPALNSELLALFFSDMQRSKIQFEQFFFDLHSKKSLSKHTKTAAELIKLLESYEIDNPQLTQHSYFKNETPCTLLIDEIETIWSAIVEKNDWRPFENKLISIRQMRGIY